MMKRLLRFASLLALVCAVAACEKTTETPEPVLDVTANNISGVWRLAGWNDKGLAQGAYVYIEFTRRNTEFTIYENLDSFSARKITGRYNIYTDEEHGAIIRGQYDYGNGDWQHRYIVRSLTKTSMTWIALDDADDISVYERCDGVPDDILSQFPSEE